jgi:hypothetical protein
VVWQRALTVVGRPAQQDRFALALDLLRAAHHSPATMVHALTLGTNHLHAHPDDALAREGVAILEAAIAFLGVKPRTGDIATLGDDTAAPPGGRPYRPLAARRPHPRHAEEQATRPERRQAADTGDLTSGAAPC